MPYSGEAYREVRLQDSRYAVVGFSISEVHCRVPLKQHDSLELHEFSVESRLKSEFGGPGRNDQLQYLARAKWLLLFCKQFHSRKSDSLPSKADTRILCF